MAIPDWPVNERPREKLLAQGAAALSDAELLAIFLRTGVKGVSAVELARHLLQNFGGLRALLEASESSFCSGKGLGAAKYAQLQAVLEMNRRHLAAQLQQGSVMDNPNCVSDYLISQLRHLKREVFACLFLDNKHCVLGFEVLFQGSINSASVHPREVVKTALSYNAAAVILAHNHPSGVAEPSLADKQITERLSKALELIEVNVIDHIIIGSSAPVSFAQRGLL
ncbi:MAG: DNA repair protein RadC [Oceanospirillaceae bacterium]|nr:DNA repair protein RadC [Oceanospirillaceae bacterium]